MKRLDRLDITGDQNVLKISIVPPIAPSMFIHEIVWTQKTIDGTPPILTPEVDEYKVVSDI